MNNQAYLKPQFKIKPIIENEAFGILHYYNAKYLNDLSCQIDTYDFITEFLPQHIKKLENVDINISFENLDDHLAGYTTYDKVVLNDQKFNSDDIVDQKMMNWTIIHEAYHRLFHKDYLLPVSKKQLNLLSEFDDKLDKIKTLNRDLGQGLDINDFCIQANYFASYFLLPRKRVEKALLKVYGKNTIELETLDYLALKDIATNIEPFFDLNIQPITIALKTYGLVKTKDQNLNFNF
ncbi:MAG: hypothetical protein GY830_11075 [Bacteroidetes bacterium]|nr:hypothetical protein [Bacteroidota bacterium]